VRSLDPERSNENESCVMTLTPKKQHDLELHLREQSPPSTSEIPSTLSRTASRSRDER
jgi:hypothetical protein